MMSRTNHKSNKTILAGICLSMLAVLCLLPAQLVVAQDTKPIAPPQVLIDAGVMRPVKAGLAKYAAMTWDEVTKTIKPTPWPEVELRQARALSPVATDLLNQAQEAIAKGEAFRAVQVLREAEKLEPDHPQVVRALGLAFAESGNLTRAAQYLRSVVTADRDDAEALLLLARHSAQSRPIEQALADCLALEKTNAPVMLADRYRAVALARLGYTSAATDRLGEAIKAAETFDFDKLKERADWSGSVRRELRVMETTLPRLRIELGDHYLQSGRYDQAANAYDQITIKDPTARHALVARQVYLAVLANQSGKAVDQVIALLGTEDVKAEDAQLVAYLVEQRASADAIAARVIKLLETDGVVLPRLVALSMVAGKNDVLQQIGVWLSSEPINTDRLRQAVALVRFDDSDPADVEALSDLLLLLAARIRQMPDDALKLSRSAINEIDAPVTLLRAIQGQAIAGSDDVYHQLVSAVTYEVTGRLSEALEHYERLLEADGPLANQVKLPTVRLLLSLGEGEMAKARIGEPNIEADWDTFELSLRALAASDEASKALTAIDRYIKVNGKELKSDVVRIEMIAEMGQPQEACNLLLRLISSHPNEESLYLLGIDLSYDHRAFFSRMTDADRMRRAFLARLITNLPDSTLARMGMAQNIMANPARRDEAEELLFKVLDADPNNGGALALLIQLYDEAGDEAMAQQMHDRYMETFSPGITRALLSAERAVEFKQMEAAISHIEQTIMLDEQGVLPGRPMTGDDASVLLRHLEAADPDRDTDGIYLKMVRRFPDDAGLNNALGYRWAVENRNLNQAEAMIQRALKQEPTNHSLLDSLAWVQYKLGDFEDAGQSQRRALDQLKLFQVRFRGIEDEMGATTAILNDHMGDIFYKQGNARQALVHWRTAMEQEYTEQDMQMDPELRSLAGRLKAKFEALDNEAPVPVAEVPGPEAHGPEGHPADTAEAQEPAAQ